MAIQSQDVDPMQKFGMKSLGKYDEAMANFALDAVMKGADPHETRFNLANMLGVPVNNQQQNTSTPQQTQEDPNAVLQKLIESTNQSTTSMSPQQGENPLISILRGTAVGMSKDPMATAVSMSGKQQPTMMQQMMQMQQFEAAKKAGLVPQEANISVNSKGGVGINTTTMGQYLSQSRESAGPIAEAAKNGDMTPYMNADRRTKTLIGAELAKEGIDASKLESDYVTMKSKARTAGTGQAMRLETAVTTLQQGLDELDRLSDAYTRSNVLPAIANRIKITADKEGTPVYSINNKGLSPQLQEQAIQYISQLNFTKDQMALVFSGGYAPQEWAYKMAVESMSPYFGQRGMKAATGQARKEINYRVNAVNNFYGKEVMKGMGSGSKKKGTDNRLSNLGLDPNKFEIVEE